MKQVATNLAPVARLSTTGAAVPVARLVSTAAAAKRMMGRKRGVSPRVRAIGQSLDNEYSERMFAMLANIEASKAFTKEQSFADLEQEMKKRGIVAPI